MFEITLYFGVGLILAVIFMGMCFWTKTQVDGGDLLIAVILLLFWPVFLFFILCWLVKFVFSEEFVIYKKKEKKK